MPTGYQVIARKWRPQVFDDVVGQDHVVRTLKNAIARGRIAHAYIFVGPRGTGKTSTARIFAKALNCTGGPKADFDPEDPAVKSIAEGTHLDVIEIDGASNNGVEQVRELRETVRYSPAQGKFKIYIIDEVHMLSAAAFNALLKTLEEPPAHVKFVFATTDVQKVLPTILSRCQRFDLKPIPADLIAGRLRQIAAAEGVRVDEAALACIARLADGGLRDGQSILDQMISFCGGEISEPDVLDVYGLVAAGKVAELAAALAAGDPRRIVAIVDDCDSAGRDLVRLLADLQAVVQAALLDSIAAGGRGGGLGTPLTTEQLTRMIDALREGETSVKLGLAEKINFEVTLLKAVEASRARSIDTLIRELAALADEAPAAAVVAQAEPSEASPGDRGEGEKKGLIDRLEARLAMAAGAGAGTSDRAADLDAKDADGSWPTEAEESAFIVESAERGEPVRPVAPSPAAAAAAPEKLPPLEKLVGQIPPNIRETLDSLFRVKFIAVRKYPADGGAPG